MEYNIPRDKEDQDITGGWQPKPKPAPKPLTYYDVAPHYTATGMQRNMDAIKSGIVGGTITTFVVLFVFAWVVILFGDWPIVDPDQ